MSASPTASKTRRYDVQFSDGKRATALDMNGDDEAKAIADIISNFQPGYVVSVTPVLPEGVAHES